MDKMLRLLAMALLAVILSGCFGGGNGGNGDDHDDDHDDEIPDAFAVTITSYPASQDVNEVIRIEWLVSSGNHSGHSMYNSIRWSTQSHAQVNATNLTLETYENEEGLQEHQNIPAGEGLPLFTEFKIDQPGMYYMRAVGRNGSVHHFSDEVVVELTGVPFTDDFHEIKIGDVTTGSGAGYLAQYSPASLTVKVGDGVKWTNVDPVASHTATMSGSAADFDTGTLEGGDTSEILRFLVEGTYEYTCTIHPETMSGTIVVEA